MGCRVGCRVGCLVGCRVRWRVECRVALGCDGPHSLTHWGVAWGVAFIQVMHPHGVGDNDFKQVLRNLV